MAESLDQNLSYLSVSLHGCQKILKEDPSEIKRTPEDSYFSGTELNL